MSQGVLYLIATPIGNLEDITLRALRILKEVGLIACEDTRQTAKLLTRYGINTPKESYHKYNEASRAARLIQQLREGKNIALVSDAGTPLLSDPGYELVASCRREGIPVIPIPGPSAALAALTASGLPADNFFFAGFLPAKTTPRKRRLQELAAIPSTLVFYEAPHRILSTVEDMILILGPRRACVARELTKIHEEFLGGTLSEILEQLKKRSKILGEITLIVEKGETVPAINTSPISLKQHLEEEMQKTGASRNAALKSVAKQRNLTRKEAYRLLIEENPAEESDTADK
jgi:16S rRNA (cytidine1402-2'-O)-methyltransferase